ncbi:MAG TPA: choice-of-anchor Q domain-containing protein [Saprospiraceae bacterium]|nr:choice-of-anchor Q domain-containing protein [Saprospiraceae bacterium]HMQ84836.1 choice-of-anchor Q domain-containing protein [Saprospiraceae bacterium]
MKKETLPKALMLLLMLLSGIFSVQAASITVTSTADSGMGSLRMAVMNASNGDVILFATALNTMPIVLTSGEILINKSLRIVGNGMANTIISGNNNSRIFNIDNAGAVTLSTLTLTNGLGSPSGGALLVNASTVKVLGCAVTNSAATGDMASQGGGGIANTGGGSLTIAQNAVISGNTANVGSGSGGGILNDALGVLVIQDSEISDNSAARAGGGIEDNSGSTTSITIVNSTLSGNSTGNTPGNGGGLHITGPGNATIMGGAVLNNTAAAEGGGLWNGTGLMIVDGVNIDGNRASGTGSDQGGGGIFNAGGAVQVGNNTIITNNMADGMPGGSGGGILNDAGGQLTVKASTISNNQAMRAGGGIEDNSGSATTVLVVGTTISNNNTGASPGNGGGVHITGPGNFTIKNSMVNGNTAAAEGGGLWNGTGLMRVENTLVNGNTASGTASDQGGGGVFNAGGTVLIGNSTVISDNVADGMPGGSGGGILNDAGGRLKVENTTITNNQAMRAGGGIEDNSGSATLISVINSTITDNSTGSSPGNGGGVHITGAGNFSITNSLVQNNFAAAEGGGLWNGTGIMRVSFTTIDGNTASGAGADQGGGGIFNAGGEVRVLDNTVITNNVANGASGSGGGILNDVGSQLTVSNTTITGNMAMRAGGGIEDNSGSATTVQINNTIITANSTGPAPGNGGGIHITGPGNMNISLCEVSGNYAAREGGGLWNGSGLMVVEMTELDNNQADGLGADDGGGGFFNNGGTVMFQTSTLSNNSATSNGGGYHNNGGTSTISYSTISGNSAVNGGGVFNGSGTIDLIASTVANNQASGSGGGLDGADISLNSSIVATNSSASGNDVGALHTITSNGFNLIGEYDSATMSSDQVGTMASPLDPMLMPLADNGGPTQTHALVCPSNPAFDAGDPALMGPDQRGMSVFGASRDIGAFESQVACFAPNNPNQLSVSISTKPAYSIYPNPAKIGNTINVTVPETENAVSKVQLFDLAGKLVFETTVYSGSNVLEIGSLLPGTYWVYFYTDQERYAQQLFLMN